MHQPLREMNLRREFIWVTIATEGGGADIRLEGCEECTQVGMTTAIPTSLSLNVSGKI